MISARPTLSNKILVGYLICHTLGGGKDRRIVLFKVRPFAREEIEVELERRVKRRF